MNDDSVRLRDAQPVDHTMVLGLNNAAVPAVSHLETADLEALAAMAYRLRLAEIEGKPVAFLLALIGPGCPYASANYAWLSQRLESFAYVDRVVVAPGAFRRGIGRMLYDELVVAAAADGYPQIAAEVNVRPANDRSLQFHATYGFDPIGEADTEGGTKRVRYLVKALGDPAAP